MVVTHQKPKLDAIPLPDVRAKLIAEISELRRDTSLHEQDIYVCGYRDGSNEAIDDVISILNKHLTMEELDAL